jgi:(1->4)-alpha-D-glucan 1-alpha-D-glucosylmutase
VLGVLIDPAGEAPLTGYYREFTGETRTFAEVVRVCKMRIMRDEMASELNVLARDAARVAYQRPETADFTQNVLRRAIREIVACFPVYRTYVDNQGTPTADDRRDLNWAMKQARADDTYIDPSVFDFLGALLSGDLVAQGHSGFSRHSVLRCAMKLQQYSGPVMAKGLEDTAFYRYNRFIALNEVGGFPDHFGTSIANFHKANLQRAKFWPHSMLTTSTHDTKRGEDVRARLAVISEMPEQWMKQTHLWSRMLRARRGDIGAKAPPDRNDEYLFYQLLVGSWPAELISTGSIDERIFKDFAERMKQTMRKSIREAKTHSTWAAPNVAYEEPVMAFIDGALDPKESHAFITEFLPFAEQIARLGVENSLIQAVLKLTAPGVPDIYQGSELWNLSLVDPDNRRPVDYCTRRKLLREVNSGELSIRKLKTLMKNWQNGAIKLFVIARVLECRAGDPELFDKGEYEPLLTAGPKADCICGFARLHENRAVLVIAARFPFRREQDPEWHGTTIAMPPRLASGRFRSIFTGKRFFASDVESGIDLVFEGTPVAVLTLEPGT